MIDQPITELYLSSITLSPHDEVAIQQFYSEIQAYAMGGWDESLDERIMDFLQSMYLRFPKDLWDGEPLVGNRLVWLESFRLTIGDWDHIRQMAQQASLHVFDDLHRQVYRAIERQEP